MAMSEQELQQQHQLELLKLQVLLKRINLLDLSDWSQLPDNNLSVEKKAEWVVYRQALRDVPDQEGFPSNINWPVRP